MSNTKVVSSLLGKAHLAHVVVASGTIAFPSKLLRFTTGSHVHSVPELESNMVAVIQKLIPSVYQVSGFVVYRDGFHAFVHFCLANGDTFSVILQNYDSDPLVTAISCEHIPAVPKEQMQLYKQKIADFKLTAVSSVEELGSTDFFTTCFKAVLSNVPLITDLEAQKPRPGVFVDGATPTVGFHAFCDRAKVNAEQEAVKVFHVQKSYARFNPTFDYKGADHKGLAGVVICNMDNGEHFQISLRPSGKSPFEHRVVIEHNADHKVYDESGKVLKWANEEAERSRQMSSVVFTGTFVSNNNAEDIGSSAFFNKLFTAVIENAPYTEQQDSLIKRVKRI